MKFTLVLGVLAMVLALTAPQTPIIDQAANASRGRSIYVHPATAALTRAEARRLEPRIEQLSEGPLYVVILPPAARREAGGTTLGVALELSRRIFTTNPPAVDAVVIGDEFRAVNRDIDADQLAAVTLRARRDAGLAAVLLDFARRVGQARREAAATPYAPLEQPNADDTGEDLLILALVIIALGAGAVALMRRRHAR
jgi:hypothetical protein